MDRDDKVLAFIQKQLSSEEEARFEAEMRADKDLAAEVTALLAARGVLAQTDDPAQRAAWDRLSTAIDAERFQPANQNSPIRFSLLQVAAAVIAAVGIWQFAAVPYLSSTDATYQTASSVEDGPRLQLRFSPEAALSEVSTALYNLGGTIVGGPSALGLYSVRFSDDASRDAAAVALRAQVRIVSEVIVP